MPRARSATPFAPALALAFKLAAGFALVWLPNGPAAATDVHVMALFGGKAMVEIDGERRLLAVGETSPEGVTLIAADTKEATLSVDGVLYVYPLGSRISTAYRPPDEPDAFRIRSNADGTYTTPGIIDDSGVVFLVDTGATQIAMNATVAERLGIDFRSGRPGLAETASGIARIWQVKLRRVKVGHIELYDVPAVVTDDPVHPRQVLLGMSFLGRLEMQRDGRVLELRQK